MGEEVGSLRITGGIYPRFAASRRRTRRRALPGRRPGARSVNLLIDTNVISEMTKPRPDPRVVTFLHETDEDRLFLSVVTLAELSRGVALKSDDKAKRVLAAWLANDLAERFSGRVLYIDPPI